MAICSPIHCSILQWLLYYVLHITIFIRQENLICGTCGLGVKWFEKIHISIFNVILKHNYFYKRIFTYKFFYIFIIVCRKKQQHNIPKVNRYTSPRIKRRK